MPRCDYCRSSGVPCVLRESTVTLCLPCYCERQEELSDGEAADDQATDLLSASSSESESEAESEPEPEPEEEPSPSRKRQKCS